MRGTAPRFHSFAALLVAACLAAAVAPAAALPPSSTPLTALTVTANTGEKPQSKVWTHAGRWWCVMPKSSGTWVWRLDGASWTSVLQLSSATGTHADVKAVGAVSHVLLYNGASSQLASIEYVPATQTYRSWTTRPANVSLPLASGTETATIDLDSRGRMWLATDYAAGADQVVVYYSDAPYSGWSGPVTLATGIGDDDIAAVVAMAGGRIGVLWSNQNTQRFGFRTHVDGTDPGTWTANEVPASQSALNVGAGMADDHVHVVVGSDGTLYAAVKTSYDTGGYPKIAFLVRRPAGTWDSLYGLDESGTRPIVLLDESAGTVTVVYTSTEGAGNILYRESPTAAIAFGASTVLIPGGLNDATSTKQTISGEVVILAGSGSSLAGVLRTGGPVGWWRMEEGSGAAVLDASGHANHGSLPNGASWVTGVEGLALSVNGTTQYAAVPNSATLGITGPITLAAWVKTTKVGTQNVIAKALYGGSDGYELNLSSAGKPFLRLNGGYRLDGVTSYVPNAWTHVAATYDGATMRIYVNGVLDTSAAASLAIASNALALGIGSQSDGESARLFSGAIDDARVYARALDANEIAALAGADPATYTITASAGANGSISPSGAVVVSAGASQAFAIGANSGYHIADVLVDSGSVGAVSGYTFSSVTANHTIVASFAADGVTTDLAGWWRLDGDATDASDYGNHGSLPNGGTWIGGVENQALGLNGSSQYVSVPHSASLSPASGLTLAAWIRPGKLGTQPVIAKETYAGTPVWGYALELSGTSPGRPFFRLDGNTPGTTRLDGVTAYPRDGTTWMHLAATFDGATMKLYVNGELDASQPHAVTIPQNTLALAIGAQSTGESGRFFLGAIDDARVYGQALSASEIQALMNHTITASAAAHGAISPAGAVAVAHGAGQAFAISAYPGYRVGDVLVDGASVGAVAGYTFTSVTRSHTIAASFTASTLPDPVTNLSVSPLASGSEGVLDLRLSWSPPPQGGAASVYRKAYGDYPRYRDGVGTVPAAPATPAAALAEGWTLTGVTAPGQSDLPPARDYWYYVVFTTGPGGASAVSNMAGALGYLLGDVTDGASPGMGDNAVDGPDVALLGWHYGAVSPAGDYLGYLDVGPTVGHLLTGRPVPDGLLEFEDLVIFAFNFGNGSSLTAQPQLATATGRAAAADALALEVPELPAVGGEFTVGVHATAGGGLHALKLELGYDAAVVEMEGVEPGELLGRQGAQAVALSPKAGRVDVALLGSQVGLTGSGELVRVQFRVKAAGVAGLRLASAEGRDGANRKVTLGGGAQVAPALPTAASFAPPAPNPFSHRTTLSFALARGGAVELGVYGVDGRKVATLVRESREPGLYQVNWDGRDGSGQPVRPGMYYAQLVTPEGRFTRRLVLMR